MNHAKLFKEELDKMFRYFTKLLIYAFVGILCFNILCEIFTTTAQELEPNFKRINTKSDQIMFATK